MLVLGPSSSGSSVGAGVTIPISRGKANPIKPARPIEMAPMHSVKTGPLFREAYTAGPSRTRDMVVMASR